NVIPNGSIKQKNLLLDNCQQVSVTPQTKLADVYAIEQNAPAAWVVEASNQVGYSRFSGATSADQCHNGSSRHTDIKIEHYGTILPIFEFYIFELNFVDLRRHVSRIRPVRFIGRHGQHFENAFHCSKRTLQL